MTCPVQLAGKSSFAFRRFYSAEQAALQSCLLFLEANSATYQRFAKTPAVSRSTQNNIPENISTSS